MSSLTSAALLGGLLPWKGWEGLPCRGGTGLSWRKKAQAGLDKATGLIRKELGARLNIFKTPAIKFERDPSIAYGNRIDELIKKLHQDNQL